VLKDIFFPGRVADREAMGLLVFRNPGHKAHTPLEQGGNIVIHGPDTEPRIIEGLHRLSLLGLEEVLADAAKGAYPVVGEFFEFLSFGGLVIYIAAN
jgi:hypothetical protein